MKDYLRAAGGVINTAIVMAAARAVLLSRHQALLQSYTHTGAQKRKRKEARVRELEEGGKGGGEALLLERGRRGGGAGVGQEISGR